MASETRTVTALEDLKVSVKIQLAALWLTLMLIYIYGDIFMVYEPDVLANIMEGKVWEFDISQAWSVGALALMLVPIFMVYLSLALRASVDRVLNVVVGIVYIVVGAGTTVGEDWYAYVVGHFIGILVLVAIVWTAWKWPTVATRYACPSGRRACGDGAVGP